jgi:hypothetical protein
MGQAFAKTWRMHRKTDAVSLPVEVAAQEEALGGSKI